MAIRIIFYFAIFAILSVSISFGDNQTDNQTIETNQTCIEDVNCGEWSECSNGFQSMVCHDSCDNTRQYIQICESGNLTNQTCIADVSCTEWTACLGGIQNRICHDSCDNQIQYIQNCSIVNQTGNPSPSSVVQPVSSGGGVYIIKPKNTTKNQTNNTALNTTLAVVTNQTNVISQSNETDISQETNETAPPNETATDSLLKGLATIRDMIENFFSVLWNDIKSLFGFQ